MSLSVTQHAIIRFAERVLELTFPDTLSDSTKVSRLDTEMVGCIKGNIFTDEVIMKAECYKNCEIWSYNWWVIVKDNQVVTIELKKEWI